MIRENRATFTGALCLVYILSIISMKMVLAADLSQLDMKTQLNDSEEWIDNHRFLVSKIVVRAMPEDIFRVLTDYGHTADIFSNVKKCEIIGGNNADKIISFEIEAPAHLGRFSYVLSVKETFPNLIQWKRISGAFKSNDGYWKLEPLADGKSTLVTYSKYIDAGFLYPPFLVNWGVRQAMPKVMSTLKAAAERYQLSQLQGSPTPLMEHVSQ